MAINSALGVERGETGYKCLIVLIVANLTKERIK